MAPDMDDEEVMKQRMSWSPAVLAQDNNAGDTKLCKMELQSTVWKFSSSTRARTQTHTHTHTHTYTHTHTGPDEAQEAPLDLPQVEEAVENDEAEQQEEQATKDARRDSMFMMDLVI